MWLHTFRKECDHIGQKNPLIKTAKEEANKKAETKNRWPLHSLNCAFVTVSNVVIRVIIYSLICRYICKHVSIDWIIHIIHPVQKSTLNTPVYVGFIEILLIFKQS